MQAGEKHIIIEALQESKHNHCLMAIIRLDSTHFPTATVRFTTPLESEVPQTLCGVYSYI